MNSQDLNHYKKFAAEIRLETLKELANLGFGHVGGAMSIVETLAVLYGGVMKIKSAPSHIWPSSSSPSPIIR